MLFFLKLLHLRHRSDLFDINAGDLADETQHLLYIQLPSQKCFNGRQESKRQFYNNERSGITE